MCRCLSHPSRAQTNAVSSNVYGLSCTLSYEIRKKMYFKRDRSADVDHVWWHALCSNWEHGCGHQSDVHPSALDEHTTTSTTPRPSPCLSLSTSPIVGYSFLGTSRATIPSQVPLGTQQGERGSSAAVPPYMLSISAHESIDILVTVIGLYQATWKISRYR